MERQLKFNQLLPSTDVLLNRADVLHPTTAILHKIAAYCKQNNLLFLPKRFLIAEKLCMQKRYITAEDLFLELKKDNCPISISCVYLNLKTLAKANLLIVQTDKNGLTHYRIIP
ncbi:transcriptional repressor [Pedobacter sp. AW1-32]|uniref:transcriptional repressor n=1 Tax=Pedobacter sp. AW1-32 TaxID=3383026 RepID=UPI003FF0BEA2